MMDRLEEEEKEAKRMGVMRIEDFEKVKREMGAAQLEREGALRAMAEGEQEKVFEAMALRVQVNNEVILLPALFKTKSWKEK